MATSARMILQAWQSLDSTRVETQNYDMATVLSMINAQADRQPQHRVPSAFQER